MSLCTDASPCSSTSGARYSGVPVTDPARAGLARAQAGAEVHEDDAAAVLAHDVLRLDVAVHEPGRVDGGEGLAQVLADQRRLAGAARRLRREKLRQGPPADELHAEPTRPSRSSASWTMTTFGCCDARQRTRFLQHAVDDPSRGRPRMQKLDRDLALQLRDRARGRHRRTFLCRRARGARDVPSGRRRARQVQRRPSRLRVIPRGAAPARSKGSTLDDGAGAGREAPPRRGRQSRRAARRKSARGAGCGEELAIAIVVELDGHQAPVETAGPFDDRVDGPRERFASWPHDASLIRPPTGFALRAWRGFNLRHLVREPKHGAFASPRAPHWPTKARAPRQFRRIRVARRSSG